MRAKGLLAAALAVTLTLPVPGMTAFGASRTRITTVSIKVDAEIVVGTDPQETAVNIEPRSDSAKYSVDDYEFLETTFAWEETDIPKLKVALSAEDGYYFSLIKKDITVKGDGITVVDYEKENDNETLSITLQFPPLSEQVTPIPEDSLKWEGDTVATWEASVGAGSYEVKVLRDGKTVGTTKTTQQTSYNFAEAMTRPGAYSFRVRAINRIKPENKGKYVESQVKNVDASLAERIRQNSSAGEWLQDEKGSWYRNADGSYTRSDWQKINEKWYYFDENGYRMTGWVTVEGKSYYLDPDTGAMLVNTTTPDGKSVGIDGALIP